MNDQTKFYMVWCPEAGHPTKKHATKPEAQQEATRLALKHPGRAYYVMAAFERHEVSQPVNVVKLDEAKGGQIYWYA